jgi:hypothetical protein
MYVNATQQYPSKIDTTLNPREAQENHRSSMPSSKWTHRSVFLPTLWSCLNSEFQNQSVTGNINQEIYRDDNCYLISHEYSAFEPREDQNLQAIRDFISNRTDHARLPTERLHAVW